eukprot:4026617-Prymnesium_polylepis.3
MSSVAAVRDGHPSVQRSHELEEVPVASVVPDMVRSPAAWRSKRVDHVTDRSGGICVGIRSGSLGIGIGIGGSTRGRQRSSGRPLGEKGLLEVCVAHESQHGLRRGELRLARHLVGGRMEQFWWHLLVVEVVHVDSTCLRRA